jgi:phage anti-repressor protein
MDNIIKCDHIDFNALVTKNNMDKSLNFRSKIVDVLNNIFTDDEKRWCIGNLYMYLNYHPTEEYPIDLENIYKLIGFSHKGNAKSTLINNFIENVDYKIALLRTQKRKNEGGTNKETIMLNVDTFKNLCMLTKTGKAKEIRMYYVKLENIFNKLLKEEMEENKKQLEEHKKELGETQKQLEKTNYDLKQKEKHINKMLNRKYYNAKKGDAVYLYKDNKHLNESLLKIGRSKNIKNREEAYSNISKSGEIVYMQYCFNSHLTESLLHHILDKYRYNHTSEWFTFTQELAIKTIQSVISFIDDNMENIDEFIQEIHPVLHNDNTSYLQNIHVPKPKKNKVVSYSVTPLLSKYNKNEHDNEDVLKENDEETYDSNNEEMEEFEETQGNNDEPEETRGNPEETQGNLEETQGNFEETAYIKCPDPKDFSTFMNLFFDIKQEYYCLNSDLTNAFKFWTGECSVKIAQEFRDVLKTLYKTGIEYVNMKRVNVYRGFKLKDFKFLVDDINDIKDYEQFIIDECDVNYSYRISYNDFFLHFEKYKQKTDSHYTLSYNYKEHIKMYMKKVFTYARVYTHSKHLIGVIGLGLKNNNGIVEKKTTSKKVGNYDRFTHKLLKSWSSLTEASLITKIKRSNLHDKVISHKIIYDFEEYYNTYFKYIE